MTFNPWSEPEERSKAYHVVDNVLSAVVHGIGFGLAVAGLVILIVKAAHTGSALRIASFTWDSHIAQAMPSISSVILTI